MHFRFTAKSAANQLSIAVRAALALALAIGVSGAIFGGGWLQSAPFFTTDAPIENADAPTGRADSTPVDLQKSNQATEANLRPNIRKLDYNPKTRSKRARGVALSINRFILERQLQSEQDDFDNAATGFLIPGGPSSW